MVMQSYYDLISMIECSRQLGGIPAFTKIRPLKSQREKSSHHPVPDDAIQAFKFCLPNMHMPKIQTIEQVLRLREDKRINKFREKILEWATLLSIGDVDSEKKIRTELKEANKELSKIETAQKLSTISTILSVPAFFADLFITGGAIGGSLMASSIGVLYYQHSKKKKYEWLLFGTQPH
jgi:hypothetical protein